MSVTLSQALRAAVSRLSAAGCADPARDARALVARAAGLEPQRLTLEGGMPISEGQAEVLEGFLRRREARQPVSQILGERQFWGRSFRVTPEVLDPRPETETIIEHALADGPAARVLDLGTGSGCLAVTLAAEWAWTMVDAVDISPEALAVARGNAEALGVAARTRFLQGSWFGPVAATYDLIVSNPPYIPAAEMAELAPDVARWEPRVALTPGGDGLDAYRIIASGLGPHLAPGGRALLEFGLGQGPAVQAIFAAEGWVETALLPDLSGRARVLSVKDRQNTV